MAIASPTPAAAPAAPETRTRAWRVVPAVATVLGVAVLLRLVFVQYLNYDARYALLWARDLTRGETPDYTADFAPTPHPLETWVSALAVPFGDAADPLLEWLILLCFGLLVWLTYRLGATLFRSTAIGVVAAILVATRPALFRDALLGYQDTAFACAIVGAVLLEVKRPKRGEAVLLVLAVAGLMRPEAWVLAGLYVLYLFPGTDWPRRIRLAALAAIAPVLWSAMDWYVTGDPLHSLHGTADLAAAIDRRRDPLTAPYWTVRYFSWSLYIPVLLGVVAGGVLAWRLKLRAALLPLAVAAVMVLVFMAGPLAGLPLITRYVHTPSILLVLFCALAIAGWLLLEPGSKLRRTWQWVGAGVVALSLAYLPWHIDQIQFIRWSLDEREQRYAQLADAANQPAVDRCAHDAGTVSAAEHRILPHLRWWLDLPPGTVSTVEQGVSPLQPVLVGPRDTPAMRRFHGERFPRPRIPGGYAEVGGNRQWRVLAESC